MTTDKGETIRSPGPMRTSTAYRRALDDLDVCVAALKVADAAINPPDRGGISLDIWNKRLKAATEQIRAAIAKAAA